MAKRTKISFSREELMAQLEEKGYVVVPKVISEEQCEQLHSGFWDYLEGMNGELNREDRSTWTESNLPLNMKGLIQHYNVGFQRFTVDAHVMLKPLFAELWGTNKLVCSFDGVSFTRKGTRPQYKDLADWKKKCWEKNAVHIDQTTPGFISVQSGLAVLDQEEDQHVFLCVPGSHKYHEELLSMWNVEAEARYQQRLAEGETSAKKEKCELHWQVMTPTQLAFLKKVGLEMVRVPLKRGDVVMWDSRTVHASAPHCASAPATSTRLQLFVCMKPADDVCDRKLREQAYETGRVSKHSADSIRLFGKQPRIYSKEHKAIHEKMKVPPSCRLSLEEKKLYGLMDY